MFVAIAAKETKKYEWKQIVMKSTQAVLIDEVIEQTISFQNDVSTLSLIFPTIRNIDDFLSLIDEMECCRSIITEKIIHESYSCYGFRVKVKDKLSWLTGFGHFDFFPTTRQTPFVEITFRIKDRPNYEWVMKKSPQDVLHLADMDMKGIQIDQFENLWNSSLNNTKKILGHKPNFISAAKTSFSIPLTFINNDN